MIWTPDRLAAAIESIEKGEPVDARKLATLQALDLVRAGRQFVIDAVEEQEAADERYTTNAATSPGQ